MADSIVIARGDGIGPEIMEAVLQIMQAAGAKFDIHEIEVGEKVYLRGFKGGIEPESWEKIAASKAFLKAPITTPQGSGFRSLNVTIRTALGLYANVRPCVSYSPYVDTLHPAMDVVIIRENEEDLYTGIEYRNTPDSFHALKVITQKGCEKIIRYAFEYARQHNRKKVTAFTKDNILKMTDGLFHKIFDEIAAEYPDIEKEHWIVDIGAAKLADSPESFDVIVLPNLYGDILSDVAAQIAGSVGLAGSANIGDKGNMFEAIHGSAPRRAGQNMANPSGLLLAAVMMLEHLGQFEAAEKIHNAWLKTLEEGIHTYDIFDEKKSSQKVGTREFGEAIIARLGMKPEKLKMVEHKRREQIRSVPQKVKASVKKELVGADFFIAAVKSPLGVLQKVTGKMILKLVSNRGLVLFPDGPQDADVSDEWRARFMGEQVTQDELVELHKKLLEMGLEVVTQQNLYTYDGVPGFSHATK